MRIKHEQMLSDMATSGPGFQPLKMSYEWHDALVYHEAQLRVESLTQTTFRSSPFGDRAPRGKLSTLDPFDKMAHFLKW